jgi:membrane-associated phospholipid phosphatase
LGEEWAFIIAGLILLKFNFRHTIGVGITALVVTIITQSLKFAFKHPRPMLFFQNEGIAEQIMLVEGIFPNMGTNSFPSGHTAAAFALFVFLAFIFKEKKWIPLILITLAILGGMARVYLVQHFYKDVVFGAFTGIMAAMISFYFQKLLWKNNISSLPF